MKVPNKFVVTLKYSDKVNDVGSIIDTIPNVDDSKNPIYKLKFNDGSTDLFFKDECRPLLSIVR